MVDYLAGRLRVADASSVKRDAERQSTQWEHAAEIRQVYGYRDFTDEGPQQEVRAFITARAWTRAEGPQALFDQAVAWLREQKILLPGPSILARLVTEIRAAESDRLHQVIASAAAASDPVLPARLSGLLEVPGGSRVSELERLRRAPARASAPQMVRSLDRASEVLAIGAGKADLPGCRLTGWRRWPGTGPTVRTSLGPAKIATGSHCSSRATVSTSVTGRGTRCGR